MRKIPIIYTAIVLLVSSGNAFAEACTYNEAKLALEKGNQIRGFSLMNMAATDGDPRAVSFLTSHDSQQVVKSGKKSNSVSVKNSRENKG